MYLFVVIRLWFKFIYDIYGFFFFTLLGFENGINKSIIYFLYIMFFLGFIILEKIYEDLFFIRLSFNC